MVNLINSVSNKKYPVNNILTIGRAGNNDVILDLPFISRNHCKITYKNNTLSIDDLKSTSGTFVNSKKVNHRVLNDGDKVYFGSPDVLFIVDYKSDEGYNENNIQLSGSYLENGKKKVNGLNKIITAAAIVIPVMVFVIGFLIFLLSMNSKDSRVIVNQVEEAFTLDDVETFLKELNVNYYHLNESSKERIKFYIRYYQTSTTYTVFMKNRAFYIDMIEDVFAEYNIPNAFTYIPFIESGYIRTAYNNYSGARGMWQFLSPTAREFGLVVNRNLDQRIDHTLSTIAAAKYIRYLLSVFGNDSILLVAASFNCGDGRIRGALRNVKDPAKDRSFFYLYHMGYIPDETREYVLKFIALLMLDKYYAEELSSRNE